MVALRHAYEGRMLRIVEDEAKGAYCVPHTQLLDAAKVVDGCAHHPLEGVGCKYVRYSLEPQAVRPARSHHAHDGPGAVLLARVPRPIGGSSN
eukprot:3343683-Pyramimonas_sp.AAC.1